MRAALVAFAGFSILMAAVFALSWVVKRPPDAAIKILGAALVALQSVAALRSALAPRRLPAALLPGGLGLAALGAWIVAGQLDPRQTDFEGYVLLTGAGVAAQGLLTLVAFAGGRRRVEQP